MQFVTHVSLLDGISVYLKHLPNLQQLLIQTNRIITAPLLVSVPFLSIQ